MTSGTGGAGDTGICRGGLASPAGPSASRADYRASPNACPASLASPAGHPQLLVPLHSGYPIQLQNALPALRPFFATIFRIGLPHTGQFGAPLI